MRFQRERGIRDIKKNGMNKISAKIMCCNINPWKYAKYTKTVYDTLMIPALIKLIRINFRRTSLSNRCLIFNPKIK
jgi:mannose/fructose/N-acetylgalactosamine-specific phosphotransferase system component IID